MPRKKRNNGRAEEGEAFAAGTPLNDEGQPADEIPEDSARQLPLDAESMRVNQQHRSTMTRKNAGQKNVPWNADHAIRFYQCKDYHPNCRVAIEQIEPRPDNTIEGKPISYFRDHDALVQYIKHAHWKGDDATYKWRAYDDLQPQWACGRVNFTADPDWAARRAEEAARRARDSDHGPQQPPPQQSPQAPFGAPPGWPPQYPYPGYQQPPYLGAPPTGLGAPPGYAQQQPQSPQQPQQAAPPAVSPSGIAPNDAVMMMLLQLMNQSTQRASQLEERAREEPIKQFMTEVTKQFEQLRQQPQAQAYPPQLWEFMFDRLKSSLLAPSAVPGAPGGPPAPSPPQVVVNNPLQPVRDAIGVMREVTRAGQEIAAIVSPHPEGAGELQPNPTDDSFPFDVKELPHMRVITHKKSGQLVDATTNLMFNADKLSDGLKNFLKEARGLLRDRSEDAIKMMKEQARMEEIRTTEAEKKARIVEDQRKKTLVDLERRAQLEERINAAAAPKGAPPRATIQQQPLPRPTARIEQPAPRPPQRPPAFEPPDPRNFVPPEPVAAPPRPDVVDLQASPPRSPPTSFEQLLDIVMKPAPDPGVPPAVAEMPPQPLPVPLGGALPSPTPQSIPEKIAPPIELEDQGETEHS